jgi:hypothetical protein
MLSRSVSGCRGRFVWRGDLPYRWRLFTVAHQKHDVATTLRPLVRVQNLEAMPLGKGNGLATILAEQSGHDLVIGSQ